MHIPAHCCSATCGEAALLVPAAAEVGWDVLGDRGQAASASPSSSSELSAAGAAVACFADALGALALGATVASAGMALECLLQCVALSLVAFTGIGLGWVRGFLLRHCMLCASMHAYVHQAMRCMKACLTQGAPAAELQGPSFALTQPSRRAAKARQARPYPTWLAAALVQHPVVPGQQALQLRGGDADIRKLPEAGIPSDPMGPRKPLQGGALRQQA